ncbi:MAG: class I SAM-dependent DNA methyltransferase [Clostridia bacterium]|nr:class I SAM-dependent DNA methyltransferase [Clostridia bacterium]
MSAEQKEDVLTVFGAKWKNVGNLDYVCCWYRKAAQMMQDTTIRTALVSTNSVCQGETVTNLWKPLFESGVHIDFAHRTFRWDSEAAIKAHVHCVIVGFSVAPYDGVKVIFDQEEAMQVSHINGYLIEADDVFIGSRANPLCNVPIMSLGNQPIDGGYYLFTKEEMEDFVSKEPGSAPYFHEWFGSVEFINKSPRYFLYLQDCPIDKIRRMPLCYERIQKVKEYRSASNRAVTRALSDTPLKFAFTNISQGSFIVVPEVSSEKRKYIPMGFMQPPAMCSNLVKVVPNASIYHFGVLTSNVHMAWMRTVCGRLEMRYRYSNTIVYNNFPWPTPTEAQKSRIEQTAQAILDARALYPEASLADLYDELTMPPELRAAHQRNDRAVMEAYGMDVRTTTESSCVAELMRRYRELTSST